MLYALCAVAGFVVGIVTTFLAAYATQARNNRHRRMREKAEPVQERKKLVEFSKIVLGFVMLTYFVGLGFGIYAVNKILLDYPEYAIQALIAIFGYVGTPITTAIGFYSWKAKAENTLKIRKENPQETEGTTFDPSNIM